jgi:molecular chaperone GrpE
MTDHEKTHDAVNDAADQTEAGAHPADNVEPHPAVVIEKLNAENVELKDRVLRTLAEMENLRRRTEKEVSDAKSYGVTNIARDMIAFADNLRRAIESVPIAAAIRRLSRVDPASSAVQAARALGISFGDADERASPFSGHCVDEAASRG